MILALSMVLSILPVSAFADAGTSAAAAETTAAGTNEETTNPVVTIKIGADGLPEKQSGTGWSCSESGRSLTITGVENAKTEYILSGEYNWNVAITNSGNEVYLLDGVVKGQLWVGNRNACVLGGSYAEAVLENGTIDGGTYGKLTENGGSVKGGYFKDISGLNYAAAGTQADPAGGLHPERPVGDRGCVYAQAVQRSQPEAGGAVRPRLRCMGGSNRWHVRHPLPACRYQQRLLERLWHDFHQCRRYNDLCRGQYVPAAFFKEQRACSTDPDPVHGQGTEFYR